MLISSIYVPERDLNLLGYPFESKVSSDEKKKNNWISPDMQVAAVLVVAGYSITATELEPPTSLM